MIDIYILEIELKLLKLSKVEVVEKLLDQARGGDVDSVKLLVELGTEGRAVRLRKELFGV